MSSNQFFCFKVIRLFNSLLNNKPYSVILIVGPMLRCTCFMRKKEESLLWAILEIQIFLIIGNFESMDLIILVYAYTSVMIDHYIGYIPQQFSFKYSHVDHDLYFTISPKLVSYSSLILSHFSPIVHFI